jgi:hypothetical protein
MSSNAKVEWDSQTQDELDELEWVHKRTSGNRPGRRFRTEQLNRGYLLLLAAHFQRYCRDLHSEASAFLAAHSSPVQFRDDLLELLTRDRSLDRANPRPATLGSDFGRLGLDLWDQAYRESATNQARNSELERLLDWRNSIAHGNPLPPVTGGAAPSASTTLRQVKHWRAMCARLVISFDRIVGSHLERMTGQRPW